MKLFVVCMDLTINIERPGFDLRKLAIGRKVVLIAEDDQQAAKQARFWLEEVAQSPERRRNEFNQPPYTKVFGVELVQIECLEVSQGFVVLPL